MSLSNSTVSGNEAYGAEGIYVKNGAMLSMTNSTVVSSGSVDNLFMSRGSQAVFSNSILSSSGTSYSAGKCYADAAAVILSLGHNLSSDNTCLLTDPTDLNDNANINFGPLQANAPGVAKTHALLAGSAAIDAGNCATGLTQDDQRGVNRPQGPSCDIGSFEMRTPIANNDAYAATAVRPLVLPAPGVLSNDVSPDGPPLSVYSVSTPANGSVSFSSLGSISYTPIRDSSERTPLVTRCGTGSTRRTPPQ